jgi:FSR family fosmidomycin resistance protein-like MFS transporter
MGGTENRGESHQGSKTAFTVLAAVCVCHLLNDSLQSLLPATYPILKSAFRLNFGQVGLITLTYQLTASVLQPLVGMYTDRHPKPYSLSIGMGFTLVGLISISMSRTFGTLLVSAAMVGMGSSVFHPESSRVARMASGGRNGLAQSVFLVGGNAGSALGPLLAAFIVVPRGQYSIAWFSLQALAAMVVLAVIGGWYKRTRTPQRKSATKETENRTGLSRAKTAFSITILMALVFSKYFYLSSLTSYYTFYLMNRFHVSVQNAQIHLFIFLGSVAAGGLIGGPLGDKIGRKYVIWFSILGVFPFTLALPYASLFWTGILTIAIGLILASAFSSIVVYAQELMPGSVGMISGLFYGFAFGMGGLGAAVLGKLADLTSISFVYHVCSFLPLIGLLTGFLPTLESIKKTAGSTPPAVIKQAATA